MLRPERLVPFLRLPICPQLPQMAPAGSKDPLRAHGPRVQGRENFDPGIEVASVWVGEEPRARPGCAHSCRCWRAIPLQLTPAGGLRLGLGHVESQWSEHRSRHHLKNQGPL